MRWRRSPAEIRYRLGQETWNFLAFLHPPRPSREIDSFTPLFPRPTELGDFLESVPAYRHRILALAHQIAEGRVPLLGTCVELSRVMEDPSIWRRDLVNGPGSEAIYFRRLPYLDTAKVGDHKVVWELNRHQHLVLLAQAACLDPAEPVWLTRIEQHIESWFAANPFHRGINWASALEVAFRALSWIWILHLAGGRLSPASRRRIFLGLYQHGAHLAHNLSIYFAPNTHLLGEAVCLHALGCLFPQLPESPRWRTLGAEWVRRSLDTQVLADGAYFEQSSFYHLYSIDLFVFHSALQDVSASFRDRLRQMCGLLAALTDRDGSFPLFGDDDGGRFFHPYGARRCFPRATLTTASLCFGEPSWRFRPEDYAEAGLWLFGPRDFPPCATPAPRRTGAFPASGFVAGGDSRLQIVFAAKAFGTGSAGHSHAHALHFTLRFDGEDLLLDSGTFTYVGDTVLRDSFRSTAAHNTLTVDSIGQGTPVNPFRWGPDRWEGRLTEVRTEPGHLSLTAVVCQPGGPFRITRSLRWASGEPVVCDDLVEGPAGEHLVEQFWHVPSGARWMADQHRLSWPCGVHLLACEGSEASLSESEVSESLYLRSPAQTLRLAVRSSLPLRLRTVISDH